MSRWSETEFTVEIEGERGWPWSWSVFVYPPGYPHAETGSRNNVTFTRRGAERWAARTVEKMRGATRRRYTLP